MRFLSCIAMLIAAMALSMPTASALLTNGPSGHALSSSLKVFGNVSVVDASGSTKDLLSIIEQQAVLIDSLTSQLAVRSSLWSSTVSGPTLHIQTPAGTYFDHPYLQAFTVPSTGVWSLDLMVRMYMVTTAATAWRCALVLSGVNLQCNYMYYAASTTIDFMIPIGWKGTLTAGAVIQPRCMLNTADSINIAGSNDPYGSSTFTAHRLF